VSFQDKGNREIDKPDGKENRRRKTSREAVSKTVEGKQRIQQVDPLSIVWRAQGFPLKKEQVIISTIILSEASKATSHHMYCILIVDSAHSA